MALSLIVYISLSLLLFALGWNVNRREQHHIRSGSKELPFYSWEILVSIILITLVMGFRFKTGSDYMMYWSLYNYLLHGEPVQRFGGIEIGFEFISKLMATLRCHYIVFFSFWGALQATLLYYGLRHRKFLLPWIGLLLILGPYAFNWFSFLRQWVVVCAFVPMTLLIEKRSFWLYSLLVLVLATIHWSALLMLLLYFLPYQRLSSLSRKTYMLIFIACVMLGLKPYFMLIFKPLLSSIPLFTYERYRPMLEGLVQGEFRWMGWGPLHIITVFAQLVFIWFYNEIKESRPKDLLLPVFFVLSFFAVCYENLMRNTDHYLLRPVELMYAMVLIMIAYTFHYLYSTKKYLGLMCCLLPVVSYVFFNVLKCAQDPVGINNTVLYHFYFIK